jgi:hypothetical protein
LQVFIDDVVGSIAVTDQLRAGVYPMVGGNCSVAREQAEIGQAARMDRMCLRAYGSQEDPAVGDTTNGWDEAQFERWLHVLSYRDLYQQKLAYVRGYLGASGADRLQDYDYRATTGSLGFLIPTTDAGQYYDEGANGRCAAYDPFNKMQLVANVGDAYRYTIQSLEYGRCGSCSSAEKEFLTGPELTVQGKVVCTLNDWNKVKLYYVQGIKGLLVVYNREVARTKRINLARNLALTGALSGVTLAAFVYLVSASTLADPTELYRRYRGEQYIRSYYRRPDVVAAFWAIGLVIFYYVATILTYYLLQNFCGYAVWDASVVAGTPMGLTMWILITVTPSLCYAGIARGAYMFHYRYVSVSIDTYHDAASTPVICSPTRLTALLVAFFSRSARTSDTGKVYLSKRADRARWLTTLP